MVCSYFAVYVLANNAWFVPYFHRCEWLPYTTIEIWYNRVLFSFLYIVDLYDRKCVFLHAFCHVFAKYYMHIMTEYAYVIIR